VGTDFYHQGRLNPIYQLTALLTIRSFRLEVEIKQLRTICCSVLSISKRATTLTTRKPSHQSQVPQNNTLCYHNHKNAMNYKILNNKLVRIINSSSSSIHLCLLLSNRFFRRNSSSNSRNKRSRGWLGNSHTRGRSIYSSCLVLQVETSKKTLTWTHLDQYKDYQTNLLNKT
jgi:hypothetical protein